MMTMRSKDEDKINLFLSNGISVLAFEEMKREVARLSKENQVLRRAIIKMKSNMASEVVSTRH